jgi:hypothetical protein
MSDLESKIRDELRGHEGDAPAFDLPGARHIARRTRRRQIVNAAGAGIGALAVVVALTSGFGGLLRADRGPTPVDTPPPSPSRELTTFSSALHEVTIGYPAGWKVRPATESWSGGRLTFDASDVDVIFDPTRRDDVYLALVSKPLGGLSRRDWLEDNPWHPGICAKTTGAGSGAISFDGARRYWSVSCGGGGSSAASGHYLRVATATRGYLIYLHLADLGNLESGDEAFFNRLLETLELEYRDPGEPVDLESYTSPDGEVSLSVPRAWEEMLWADPAAPEDVWFGVVWPGPEIGDDVESIGLVDPVAYDAWCAENGGFPLLSAAADAAAIAQQVIADPNFETTAPVAARVGGLEAVSIDAELAPGGEPCGVYMFHIARWIHGLVEPRSHGLVKPGMRLRLYLVDLPEGMSVRTLAITAVAPKERFEEFIEESASIIESIEFHPSVGASSPTDMP